MLRKLGKRNLAIILSVIVLLGAVAGVLTMTLGRGGGGDDVFPPIKIPPVDPNVQSYVGEFERFAKLPEGYNPANRSYSSAMTHILKSGTLDSLYLIQIRRVFSPEEAKNIEGYDPFRGDNSCTFYRATLLYDFLRERPCNEEIVYCSQGRVIRPLKAQPPYSPGDVVFCFLFPEESAREIREPGLAPAFLITNSDTVTAGTFAYNSHYQVLQDFESIEVPMSEGEETRASVYSENPWEFVSKYKLGDLVEFLKNDLEERGFVAEDK